MTRLRLWLSLILVSLWIPSTAHCLFEGAGVIKADGCCRSESADDSCASICDSLESDGYRLPDLQTGTLSPALAVCHAMKPTPVIPGPEPERARIESDSLPPWQFASRAALSPRAP